MASSLELNGPLGGGGKDDRDSGNSPGRTHEPAKSHGVLTDTNCELIHILGLVG